MIEKSPFHVHRCRFVDYVPSAINSMSFISKHVKHPLLACARANGDIEIWNPLSWYIERIIPGISGSGSIESVVWLPVVDDSEEDQHDESVGIKRKHKQQQKKSQKLISYPRLFSAGLDGYITEWNLVTLNPISRVESGGGAIWSMAVSPSGKEIAIGCEDGCARIFEVLPPGLADSVIYKTACDRQDSRILSVAFHPFKPILSAGSSDSCIRSYSTQNYRLLNRLTVDTGRRNEETLVWTLLYLSTGTLVSGDSMGAVSFFDDESGIIMKSIKSHHADVLCLAGGSDGDVVFSSGVDRRVIQYRFVDNSAHNEAMYMVSKHRKPKFERNWVLTGDRRFHSHDVRALALCETKPIDSLVSGGMDATFVVSTTISLFPDSKQQRQSSFPQRPLISLAPEARLLLARFDNTVKVWELGRAAGVLNEYSQFGERVPVAKKETLVADLKIKGATNLTCSAISADGCLIVVSDLFETRLFGLQMKPKKITRRRKFPSPSVIPGSVSAIFTTDSKRIILAGTDSVIRVVDVAGFDEFEIVAEFTEHRGRRQKNLDVIVLEDSCELVPSLAVSSDGQWLATGDLANRMHIYNLDSLKFHARIPQLQFQHTSIKFISNSSNLVISSTTNEISVYDVETVRLTEWSQKHSHAFPAPFSQRTDIIMGSASCESNPEKIVFWSANYLASVDTRKAALFKATLKRKAEAVKKGQRRDVEFNHSSEGIEGVDQSDPKNEPAMISLQFGFGPIMFFDFLNGEEAVIVERPILSVMDALPNGFYRKTFSV